MKRLNAHDLTASVLNSSSHLIQSKYGLCSLYLASKSITDFLFDVVQSLPVALSSALKIYLAWMNDLFSNLFACTITLKSISEHCPFKSGVAGALYVGG